MVDNLNPKPVGFANPSDLTMLGIGVDVGHININRDRTEKYSVPLYTFMSDWKVMGHTPPPQPREVGSK